MKNKSLARDEMRTHEMAVIYITGDGRFLNPDSKH